MKKLGMFFLTGLLLMTNSFLAFAQTTDKAISMEQNNEYDYCIQEIVDEINQKYDIDLQVSEPAQFRNAFTVTDTKKLTKEEFSAILNEKAAQIAEHRDAARKQFEERTGRVPFEENEKVGELNNVDSTRSTIKNYSKTKKIEYIPVTVTGKVITDSYTRFYNVSSVTAEDVISILPGGMNRRVTDIDKDLIDSGRTCAVVLDIFIDYYDAQLGQIVTYNDSGYGEFYASEG
ncbi:MAG: hypothetical protein GX299_04135 [Epulopiscium sp.]|nr:hypothetical protein [Candidatus Epulonipiscium sp.]